MKTKHVLYIAFFFVTILVISSCNARNRGEWIITDVSKDTILTAVTKVKKCNRLILEITGETDDSIKINSIEIQGGKILDTITYDWYYPEITVPYEAYKATKGYIKIKYYLPGNRYF